jgi:hypothetical protein
MAPSSASAGAGASTRRLPDVSDTPKSIRIPDDLWRAALEKAHASGDTLSDVVRRALERYVARK